MYIWNKRYGLTEEKKYRIVYKTKTYDKLQVWSYYYIFSLLCFICFDYNPEIVDIIFFLLKASKEQVRIPYSDQWHTIHYTVDSASISLWLTLAWCNKHIIFISVIVENLIC